MDWLTNLLPDGINYWLIIAGVLGALNVYQFAKARGLTSKLDHMFEHGHQPEGKVLVPADSIAHVIDEPTPRIVSATPLNPWKSPPPWKVNP